MRVNSILRRERTGSGGGVPVACSLAARSRICSVKYLALRRLATTEKPPRAPHAAVLRVHQLAARQVLPSRVPQQSFRGKERPAIVCDVTCHCVRASGMLHVCCGRSACTRRLKEKDRSPPISAMLLLWNHVNTLARLWRCFPLKDREQVLLGVLVGLCKDTREADVLCWHCRRVFLRGA